MRILNIPTHSANALVSAPQREAVLRAAVNQDTASRREAVPGEIRQYQGHRDEWESLIRALDERHTSGERLRARYDTEKLDSRARQALEAYRTHQDLLRREAESDLQQMMGVDYYV